MKLLFGITLLIFASSWLPMKPEPIRLGLENQESSQIETFTFLSNGKSYNGKVYLPPSYRMNKNLPSVFLIDFTEQHFKLATDEFEKVIEAVASLDKFEALIASLEEIADIDAKPENFEDHYAIYKDMTAYIKQNYSKNKSRTLIARGSESGIVLMSLFRKENKTSTFENFVATDPSGLYGSALISLLKRDDFPKEKGLKKLHFSFSTSNDRSKCTEIINLIEKADYQWLNFKSKEYANSDYENTYPVAYADGLKFVFEN